MTTSFGRPFAVISGAQVHRALDRPEKRIMELAEASYRLMVASGSRSDVPVDPGAALGDEPEQGRGLGVIDCRAKGTEGNPPR